VPHVPPTSSSASKRYTALNLHKDDKDVNDWMDHAARKLDNLRCAAYTSESLVADINLFATRMCHEGDRVEINEEPLLHLHSTGNFKV
jgi:hypothetical protein